MKKRGVARVYILLTILGILIVVLGGLAYLDNNQMSSNHYPIASSLVATTTPSKLSPSTPVAPVQKKTAIEPAPQLSSSTAQVGDYTVVVDCKDNNPKDAQIVKNGSIVQTVGIDAAVTGVSSCPKAQSQDINFDGSSDFMVLSDDGSGGSSMEYWLFSTSTQQFSCSEKYNNCFLMNPEFNETSKTIISTDYTSAGSTNVQTFGVVNGNLVLISNINNNY